MLAWFKKKFGKQEPSQPAEPEQEEENLLADEIPASQAGADIASAEDIASTSVVQIDADDGPTAPISDSVEEKAEPIAEQADSPLQGEQATEMPAQLEESLPDSALEPEASPQDQTEQGDGVLRTEQAVPETTPLSLEPGRLDTDHFADAEGETAGTATVIEEIAEEQAAIFPETSEEPVKTISSAPAETESVPESELFIKKDNEQEDESAADAPVEETASDVVEAKGERTDSEEEKRPVSSYTQEKPAAKSMFRRLQDRLGKSRSSFVYQLDRLFMGEKEINQDLFDQLEELLITADLGVSTTMDLLDKARRRIKRDLLSDPQALKNILKEEMLAYITASDQPAELVMPEEGPFVIMVVGVNGVGKTTTIGKIAAKFVRSGQSVLLIAGDTFRAAAIDQLKIWGERVGVEVMAQKSGSDPASVVFDGIDYGVAQGKDVILIDTAGRLHTSVNLMEELKKIQRVIGKRLPGAPHEVLQVLDATTGQNGIAQAKLFHEAVGVSGLALTKLDGTAKGGIVANICRELKIPVRFIGIGEQLDDLRDFDAKEFVDALFAESVK